MCYQFQTTLWKWKGDSAWHFATVPDDVSDEIEALTAHERRGFGSVRVRVRREPPSHRARSPTPRKVDVGPTNGRSD